MAKISIIIPVYNTAVYLRRCLDSVLNQTHEDIEVVLVNDGSTDGSAALCDQYAADDSRVRVIHQQNGGLSAARNAGLKIITGEYLGFVDSDDWVLPDTYAYLLGLIEQEQADIAEIAHEVAYSEKHLMKERPEKIEVFRGEQILVHYFELNEFSVGFRLYRSQVFSNVSFEIGRINEDVVAGFLALRNADCLVNSNQTKYFYYSNPVGISESPLRLRDMDLLYAGERLDELTVDSTDERLRKLALTKKYRSYFTLLVKMTIFGCSVELDQKQTERELKVAIKQHYGFLMSSQMPLNRKIMLTGCRFCYPMVKLAAVVYRSFRR